MSELKKVTIQQHGEAQQGRIRILLGFDDITNSVLSYEFPPVRKGDLVTVKLELLAHSCILAAPVPPSGEGVPEQPA